MEIKNWITKYTKRKKSSDYVENIFTIYRVYLTICSESERVKIEWMADKKWIELKKKWIYKKIHPSFLFSSVCFANHCVFQWSLYQRFRYGLVKECISTERKRSKYLRCEFFFSLLLSSDIWMSGSYSRSMCLISQKKSFLSFEMRFQC